MSDTVAYQNNYNQYSNNISSLELLYEALASYGIPSPMHIKCDGFTRWGKNSRYWAVVCYDGYCFGDFAAGFFDKVFPKKQYDKSEWQKRQQAMEEAKRKSERLLDEERKEAAHLAYKICEISPKMGDDFPYLQNKKILSFGLRTVSKSQLSSVGFDIVSAFAYKFTQNCERFAIIPLMNCNGSISSIQFINNSSKGKKRFLPNGKKQGCYYPIGNLNKRIFLVEGYATGASVHMATGELTICCFDAGNLLPVAVNIRNHYPDVEIIICADNDDFTENNKGEKYNTGKEEAKKAAIAINAPVVFPIFQNTSTKPTDFNDLHCLESLDSVREQINNAFLNRNGGGSNE